MKSRCSASGLSVGTNTTICMIRFRTPAPVCFVFYSAIFLFFISFQFSFPFSSLISSYIISLLSSLLPRLFVPSSSEKEKELAMIFLFLLITFSVEPAPVCVQSRIDFLLTPPSDVYLGSSRRLVFMLQLVFHALLISRGLCVYIYIHIHTRRSLLIQQQQPRQRATLKALLLPFFFIFACRKTFLNRNSCLSFSLSLPPYIYICPISQGMANQT